MKDLRDCINRAVRAGGMDPARAQRVLDDYQRMLSGMQHLGPSQAQATAAKRIVDAVKREAAERRRIVGLAASKAVELGDRLRAGPDGPGQALRDIVSNPNGSGGVTLAGQFEAVRRDFRRELTRFIARHRATLIGTRRGRAKLDNVVDEVFGRNTGDPEAKVFARAWADAAERARLRFNAAGGRIPKRADWGLPQHHDARAIRKAGYDTWRASILPKLDLAKMVDDQTGLPYSPQQLEARLREAYDSILSDGWSRREASSQGFGRAAYNSRLDHRFFVFKGPQEWRAYQGQFGSGDAFRVMLGHLDSMAKDIAEMEVLGPNPTTMFQFLKQTVTQVESTRRGPAGLDKARAINQSAQNMLDLFRGTTNSPANRPIAATMSAVRQYLASAHLGSAVISSLTDFNTQRVAAAFVGMHRLGFMRNLGRLIGSKEFRLQAAEAGLILENAVDMGHAAGRFQLEDLHIESAARLADFTIRASGLGYLTEIQRQAFGMEFFRHVAKQQGKSWDQLDAPFRRAFERYGIDAKDWAVLSAARKHNANGVQIVRAAELAADGHQALADRYLEMVTSLTEYAVPSTSIRGRAAILGTTRPGSIEGEFMRSFMQFKAFPVTVMTTQARRVIEEGAAGRKMNAATYAASFLVGSTIMGALAMQLKEVAKGRDPRKMDSPNFWMAAAAQGGGLGLFGDFMFADLNRFGMSPWQQSTGPALSFAADVGKLTVGNVQQLVTGQDTQLGADLLQFARRYTPGGSLWYARLAYEREVLDQIQQAVDPKAARRFRARERSARQFDTEYFWKPGQSAISGDRVRAPDFGNALGQ